MENKQILLVEDDKNLGRLLMNNLRLYGFSPTLANDGATALELALGRGFDIGIFDIMLPYMDGLTLAREIRKTNLHMPIVFLTARALKPDKIEGFHAGGDDYITKPFDMDELVCRINVLLKRSVMTSASAEKEKYVFGNFCFTPKERLLCGNGLQVRLTSKESALLEELLKNQGSVVKREEILHKVWERADPYTSGSMDVYISKIRKLLKHDSKVCLENIHGLGFILQVPEITTSQQV